MRTNFEREKVQTTSDKNMKRKKRPTLLMEPPPSPPPPPARNDQQQQQQQQEEEVATLADHHHYNCHRNSNQLVCCAGEESSRGLQVETSRRKQHVRVNEDTRRAFLNEKIINKWQQFHGKSLFPRASETKSTSVIQQQPQETSTGLKMTCRTSDHHKHQDDHCDQQWTQQQQQHKRHLSRQRQSRRNDLAGYLMILFGSICLLLLSCCPLTSTTSLSLAVGEPKALNASFGPVDMSSPVNFTATTTAKVVVGQREQGTGNSSEPTAAATLEETDIGRPGEPIEGDSAAGDESSTPEASSASPKPTTTNNSGELSPGDNDDEAGESDDQSDQPDGKSKLGELLVETADSGVDVMLSHLRPSAGSDDAEEPATTSTAATTAQSEQENKHKASALKSEEEPTSEELKVALETYAKWRLASDDIIELVSRKLMPMVVEHGYDVDTSTATALLQVFNGIRALKPWALKLLDASAKLTPGLLVGTQSDFGDFDECLNVRVDDPSGLAAGNGFPAEVDPSTGLASSTLVGKYCLADVEFPKPPRIRTKSKWNQTQTVREEGDFRPQTEFEPIELRRPLLNFSQTVAFKETIFVETGNFFHMLYVDPIRVGVCLTNKIDADSFAQVLNKLLEEFKVTINFRGRCVTKYDRPTWTSYQIASAYILLVACSLVVLSTLLDLAHLKLHKLPCPRAWRPAKMHFQRAAFKHRPLFTSFSVIRNTKRLFKTSPVVHRANQYNLNLGQAVAGATTTCSARVGSGSVSVSLATTTSSIPDSSVESSPSIERRSCSLDANSATDLILQRAKGAPTDLTKNINRLPTVEPVGASCLRSASVSGCSSTSSMMTKEEEHKQGVSMLSLHGIRVITMTWMIVNHTYLFGGFFVLWAHRRLIDIAEWPKSMSFQFVLNGWLTVETYFFLSALIIVISLLPLMKVHKFNYATYVIHRLLRLLPAYVGLVCLNFLWPLISSGPVWLVKGRSFIQTPCENYLWTNFLFINNWIWPEKQCMVHTWFLSADFQLYVFAPIIVYLLYRRPTLGHSVNLIVAILASILSGFVIYANKLLPTTLINKLEFDSVKQQLSYSYFATYQHMGPYCLGILTGYVLHTRPTIRLPKHLTWLLWLLLPPLSFTTLMLTYLWNGAYDDPDLINPSPLVSALYVAIHRIIWTSLVAWIVFATATGRAKLLSNFLSHSIFIPLSRLSYSIYLVHLPVILFRALNLRHTIEWTDSNILWEACGNFVMSLIMGFFLNIAFESPMVNLENVIFGRRTGQRDEHAPCIEQTEASSHCGRRCRGHVDPTAAAAALKVTSEQKYNPTQNQSGRQSPIDANCCYLERKDSAADQQSDLFHTKSSLSSTLTENDCRSMESGASREANNLLEQTNLDNKINLSAETASQLNGEGDLQSKLSPNNRNISSNRRRSLRAAAPSKGTLSDYNDHQISNQIGSNLTTSIDLLSERRQQQQQQLRRMSSYVDEGYQQALNENNNDGDTYNIRAEYQHYAPGAYQQWRLSNLSSRPSQYATLARNHRLSQHLYHTNYLDGPPKSPLSSASVRRHRKEPSLAGGPINRATKPTDHHGQPTYVTSLIGQTNIAHGEHPKPRVGQVLSRGQGRYYTLTGTSSKDWRLRYDNEQANENLMIENWRNIQHPPTDGTNQTNASKWLPPGTMIPRVDSSTLRRQSRRPETAETSIVEEAASEENSIL